MRTERGFEFKRVTEREPEMSFVSGSQRGEALKNQRELPSFNGVTMSFPASMCNCAGEKVPWVGAIWYVIILLQRSLRVVC